MSVPVLGRQQRKLAHCDRLQLSSLSAGADRLWFTELALSRRAPNFSLSPALELGPHHGAPLDRIDGPVLTPWRNTPDRVALGAVPHQIGWVE